jgi:methylglyoxal synthase
VDERKQIALIAHDRLKPALVWMDRAYETLPEARIL